MSYQDLLPFFRPRGVAVVGASRNPAKLSYAVVRNLATGAHRFPGPVYPINPQADEILGLRCYPSLAAAPDPVDLAVLIVPAAAVLAAVEACGKRGVKAIILISGGFREIGAHGAAREDEVVALARRYGMRLLGPNGIGVMDTHTPLNTTFVKDMPPSGHIAFLSQSGALCGGVIDWAIRRGIGFSRLLSIGNQADVTETEWLPFLAADDSSQVIALYLEDVKGGPAFVQALAAAAAVKPVLALKAGRTASGQAATASHTGAGRRACGLSRRLRADRRHRGIHHPGAFSCRACPDLPAAAGWQPVRHSDQRGRPSGPGRGRAGSGGPAPGAQQSGRTRCLAAVCRS